MFSRHQISTFTPICVAMLLAGCAITRVDPPPPVAAPAQFKEDGAWQRAPVSQQVPDDWWKLFNDPVLDALQQRLVVGNESLKSLSAAIASARAAVDASQLALYPTVSGGFSATRSRTPAGNNNSTNNSNNTTNNTARTANSYSLSASASWELDLWGRLGLAETSAQSALQASADDLAQAKLSAQATLVQTYFSLRTADAQIELLERSVAAYERSLTLTQARYDGGVAGRTDLLQAQTQLNSARAQLADLTAQRAQLEHAIATLLGTPASTLSIARVAMLPMPPEVPQILPATLLERRPDIAAAQRRVASAYAQIGIADAAFFPSLSLSAGTGYSSSKLSDLISAPHFFWSLGSSLTQSIFDGGQRRLASTQARATADQVTSNYRQVVLTALQEVEDNLVLANQLQNEVGFQENALKAARENLDITNDQYRAGTVSYLNVVVAQTSALTTETNLLTLRNRQIAATNQLFKNIAGRWEPVTVSKR